MQICYLSLPFGHKKAFGHYTCQKAEYTANDHYSEYPNNTKPWICYGVKVVYAAPTIIPLNSHVKNHKNHHREVILIYP